MNDVFPSLDGFETQTPFMQKRALLEHVMIKYVIEGERVVPLDNILNDVDIRPKNTPDLGQLLQAVVQNKAIFLSHQDLYNRNMIWSTTDLDITIECDPFFINKWIKNADSEVNVFSFKNITQDKCKVMIGELNEKISLMKKIIENK